MPRIDWQLRCQHLDDHGFGLPLLGKLLLVIFAGIDVAGAQIHWKGGNNTWINGGATSHWSPADEPDSNDIAVFSTANTVPLGSDNAVAELRLSGGIGLNLNGFDLDVQGAAQLTGSSSLTVPTNSQADIGGMSIDGSDGGIADLRLRGGNVQLTSGTVFTGDPLQSSQNAFRSVISGQGSITLAEPLIGSAVSLSNDGAIVPSLGTITIRDVSGDNGGVDLDGRQGDGVLDVHDGDNAVPANLRVLAPLADAEFNGTIFLGKGGTLEIRDPWSFGSGGVMDVIDESAGVIAGGTMTQTAGSITVRPEATLQFNGPLVLSGGNLTTNGRVTFNSSAVIGAAARLTMPTSTSRLLVNPTADVSLGQLNFSSAGTVENRGLFTIGQGTSNVNRLDVHSGSTFHIGRLNLQGTADTVASVTVQSLNFLGGTIDVRESSTLVAAHATFGSGSALFVDGLASVALHDVTFQGGTAAGDGTLQLWGPVHVADPTAFHVPTGFIGTTTFDESETMDLVIGRKGVIYTSAQFTSLTGRHRLRNLAASGLSLESADIDIPIVNEGSMLLGENLPYLAQATVAQFQQTATGSLHMHLAGTGVGQFDRLIAQRTAQLAGALNVSLLNGFVPSLGDDFEILSAPGGITGRFNATLPTVTPDQQWNLLYSATAVSMRLEPATAIDAYWDSPFATADWAMRGNWDPDIVPDSPFITAVFENERSTSVRLNRSVTLAGMRFNSREPVTIDRDPNGAIDLDPTSGVAKLHVWQGGHEILVPLTMSKSTDIFVGYQANLVLDEVAAVQGVTRKMGPGVLHIANTDETRPLSLEILQGTVESSTSNHFQSMINRTGTWSSHKPVTSQGVPIDSVPVVLTADMYIQEPRGRLRLAVNDTVQAGEAQLAGELEFYGDVPIQVADQFVIFQAAVRSGDFDAITGIDRLADHPDMRMVPYWQAGVNEERLVVAAAEVRRWAGGNGSWDDANRWRVGPSGSAAAPGLYSVPEIVQNAAVTLSSSKTVHGMEIRQGQLSVNGVSLTVLGDLDVGTVGESRLQLRSLSLPAQVTASSLGLSAMSTFDLGVAAQLTVTDSLRGNRESTGPLTGRWILADRSTVRLPITALAQNDADITAIGTASMLNSNNQNILSTIESNGVGGKLTLQNHQLSIVGGLANAGRLALEGTSQLIVNGPFSQSSGVTSLQNSPIGATEIELNGGRLEGSGILLTPQVTNRAVIAPGSSPGTLLITGDYRQTAEGRLEIEIAGLTAGTEHDALVIQGNANIAGTLQVELLNGFRPANHSVIRFLDATTVTGTFGSLETRNVPSDLAVSVEYSPAHVSLRFQQPIPINYDQASGGGNWSALASWLGGTIPNSVNAIDVVNTTNRSQELSVNIDAFSHALSVSGGNPMTVSIDQDRDLSVATQLSVLDNGLVNVTNGNLHVQNVLVGAGQIRQSGGQVQITGNMGLLGTGQYQLNGGTLDLNGGGIFQFDNLAQFDMRGGKLEDISVLGGGLRQLGGKFAPNRTDAPTDIQGEYQLTAGTLTIRIHRGENDRVDVDGATAIAGTLEVDISADSDFTVGSEVTILTTPAGTGQFENVVVKNAVGYWVDVRYVTDSLDAFPLSPWFSHSPAQNAYTRIVLSGASLGDENSDGLIDQRDAAIFVEVLADPRFRSVRGRGAEVFDMNGDTRTNFGDIRPFLELFEPSDEASLALVAQLESLLVPEPGSAVWVMSIGGLLFRRKRVRKT